MPLESSDSVRVDAENGRVVFQPLHETNRGNYSCKASNDVGHATAYGEVKVRGSSCKISSEILHISGTVTIFFTKLMLFTQKNSKHTSRMLHYTNFLDLNIISLSVQKCIFK